MTFDLASMIIETFSDIIGKYKLRLVPVEGEVALIVGQNYALKFAMDRDELDGVQYIERGSKSALCS